MLAAPLLMNYGKAEDGAEESSNGSEGTVLGAMGATILAQSLMTDYELGAMKVIDMKAHLMADVAGGILLAATPWLFNMSPRARVPFAVLGFGIAVIGLLTNTQPQDDEEDNEE
jgi:hypothetical protein